MAKSGIYLIKNTKKYKGNKLHLKYRSTWEKKYMDYCDLSPSITQWNYESIRIPYVWFEKKKFYYPDFWIKNRRDDEILIEIKPRHQINRPRNRKAPSYKRELKRWMINQKKWDAAKKYCDLRNIKFLLMTK